MGRKLFPSPNGFEFLEHYLTELYGERGSIKHNLIRYIESDYFKAGCRYVNNIEDLPEISFNEIKQIIEREKRFRDISIDLQKRYDQLLKEGKLTEEDYRVVAGIMGRAPGSTDRLDTLFPNALDLYVCSEEDGEKIWNSVCSKPNVVAVMVGAPLKELRDSL